MNKNTPIRRRSGAPAPSPLSQNICSNLGRPMPHEAGWSMLETMLVLGAISAFGFGMWKVFGPASVAAQVREEQGALTQFATAVHQSTGLVGTYAIVTNNRSLEDRLVPNHWLRENTADVRDVWGQSLTLSSWTINAPNDSFSVLYPAVPAEACTGLANAMARQAFDIVVEGQSVFNGNAVDPNLAVARCNREDGAEMRFVFFSGLVQDSTIASTTLPPGNPPLRINPTDQTPATINAPDGGGTSNPGVSVPPASNPGGPSVSPPGGSTPPPPSVVVTGTPPSSNPPGVTDPTVIGVACNPSVEFDTQTCPAGQYGTRDLQRTFSCPEAWESAVAGPWTVTNNNCIACPAPSNQTETQWTAQSAPCPVGFSGSNTWEREETRSRTISYNCPAGTASLPAPTLPAWSGWTATGATRNAVNTCFATCTAQPDEIQTQTIALDPVVAPCPPGFNTGSITTTREADQQRTRSWQCPSSTWSAWGAWATVATRDTGTLNTCSVTCAPQAPVVSTQTQWVGTTSRVDACPSDQFGRITTTREAEQQRTQTDTYTCPAGTWSSAFGSWANTGGLRDVSSSWSCTNCPAPVNETETQWVAGTGTCPVGTSGTVTLERQQQRTRTNSYNCPAGTTVLPAISNGSWSAWSNTGVTRNEVINCPPIASVCPPGSNANYEWIRVDSQAAPDTICAGNTVDVPSEAGECSGDQEGLWLTGGPFAARNTACDLDIFIEYDHQCQLNCTAPVNACGHPSGNWAPGCEFDHCVHMSESDFQCSNPPWNFASRAALCASGSAGWVYIAGIPGGGYGLCN